MAIPSPTSLRARLLLSLALPVCAACVMAAAALWGLGVVHRDMGAAVRGYQEMREAYEVGLHAAFPRAVAAGESAAESRRTAVPRLSLALAAVVVLASAAGGLLLHRRIV